MFNVIPIHPLVALAGQEDLVTPANVVMLDFEATAHELSLAAYVGVLSPCELELVQRARKTPDDPSLTWGGEETDHTRAFKDSVAEIMESLGSAVAQIIWANED